MCSYWAPSVSACNRSGAILRSSGLVMMLPIFSKAIRAASFTLACWSFITVQRAGTTCGRHAASCFGKQLVIDASSSMLPSFVRHCWSLIPSSSGFSTCLTPGPLSCDIMALAAVFDAVCTLLDESEKACNSNGSEDTTYGSKSRPRLNVRPSRHINAPSRTAACFLSSAAASILLRMPCCETAWMLRPFTVAPSPIAEPRLVTSFVLGASAVSRSCSSVSVACSLFCLIRGGITFTMASCTDVLDSLSMRRCKSRGRTSGNFGCPAGKCFDNAPRKTATPRRADSPAAAPTPLSSKSSIVSMSMFALSSPCRSINEMPAANSRSRRPAASGVPPEVNARPCRRRNLKALMTCSSSPRLEPKTCTKHLATVIREAASSRNSCVSRSRAVEAIASSSNSVSTSATALAIRFCTASSKPDFLLANSISSISNASSPSSSNASDVSLATSSTLGSSVPRRSTARIGLGSNFSSWTSSLSLTAANAEITTLLTCSSSAKNMLASCVSCSSVDTRYLPTATNAACVFERSPGNASNATFRESNSLPTRFPGNSAPAFSCSSIKTRDLSQTLSNFGPGSDRARKTTGRTIASVPTGIGRLASTPSKTSSQTGVSPGVPACLGSRCNQALPATIKASGKRSRLATSTSETTRPARTRAQRRACMRVSGDFNNSAKCGTRSAIASSRISALSNDSAAAASTPMAKFASSTYNRMRARMSDCSWILAASMSLAVILAADGAAVALAFALPPAFAPAFALPFAAAGFCAAAGAFSATMSSSS
mmetsp:Transcript_16614/g.32456  ORF Transcript_16614/g.32456 Transcript_16614/m.32456 type:complete len:772 (+) Transcript_16614:3399-5714(+)